MEIQSTLILIVAIFTLAGSIAVFVFDLMKGNKALGVGLLGVSIFLFGALIFTLQLYHEVRWMEAIASDEGSGYFNPSWAGLDRSVSYIPMCVGVILVLISAVAFWRQRVEETTS